jgi:cytochrome bd-type quinol oxidase subunit 2
LAERAKGGARLLVVVYAIFAIAATSRSAVQLTTRFDEAPLAYLLSAIAALVYIVATIALSRGDRTSRRVARAALIFELSGVLIVGAVSLLLPDAFPRATVWSTFGSGYLFIPLALPIIGLWWLRKSSSNLPA